MSNNNLIPSLIQSIAPSLINQLSAKFGFDEAKTNQILIIAVPLIVTGLKKLTEQGGTDKLNGLLDQHANIDNIANMFLQSISGGQQTAASGLTNLLGNSAKEATDTISNKFNLNQQTATQVIGSIAPLVMNALSQKRDGEGIGASGIASLIDQNGDGQIMDDIAGLFMKNFK